MKSLTYALLLCVSFFPLTAAAELNGLPPQRRSELERLMADPHTLRGEALAASRSIELRLGREDVTEVLRLIWAKVAEIDAHTLDAGDDLNQQIAMKLGQGRFTASVAADLRRCVENSVDGRRVIIYGYLWPKTVAESLADIALPSDLSARLELKATADEIKPLGFSECGAVMRGYEIFPRTP